MPKFLLTLLALAAWPFATLHAQTSTPDRVIQDNDRIVFIGDSITGQGAKGGKGGWIAMIGEGLHLARPETRVTLTGLGGSGATVGAWQNFEKRSRTEPLALDVKETDVGKTLDAGAEIVVVMLGMNDVLSPSLKNSPADFDAWRTRYRDLVEAIRARSRPRVVALATVTPCTEDPASPKNQVLAELNRRLIALAGEQHFLVLPTNAAAYEVQALGRAWQPGFHVTGDFVHPNAAGHLAIAAGMLRGLGETDGAAKLLEAHAALYRPAADKLPALSYTLARAPGSPDDATQRFTVHYQWTGPAAESAISVKLELPHGWQASPESANALRGDFALTGPLEMAENIVRLVATSGGESREQRISIPAGWRIVVGEGKGLGWTQNSTYDPAQDRQALDASLAGGEGLTSPVPFPTGDAAPWKLYVASNDYTGLNRPGSVDLAAVIFFKYHQQSYGARWIWSERERPVTLHLASQSFAGTHSLSVWLNGRPAYEGKPMGEPGHQAAAETTLQRGWNLLLFKSTFIQWQWQFSIDLTGRQDDDLTDLRYATRPPPVSALPASVP